MYVAEELGGRERLAVFICELVRVYECCLDRCPFKREAYQTLPIVMVAVLEDKGKNITHLIKSYRKTPSEKTTGQSFIRLRAFGVDEFTEPS